jgi:DNA-binding GntR family transcriptional regulator
MSSVRLSEKAYHLIKEKIITLDLAPLSVIDEQTLCGDLELGRTPIREALHRLSAEGLVLIAPRRGMFVADISITDLVKIFEVRMAMEGYCARLAAKRVTPAQIAEMEETVRALGVIPRDDWRGLMEIDERFHHLLYQAADNEFLADSLDRLHALSLRLWFLVLDRLGDVWSAIEQHRSIVDALKVGDTAGAERLITQHISDFQNEIKEAL